MIIAITGAAGFIGSALVRHLCALGGFTVHGLDKLTYAANPLTVAELEALPDFTLHRIDIADAAAVQTAFTAIQPDAVFHLAAETHVDRSIDTTAPFIATNLYGTYNLLQNALHYWQRLPDGRQHDFRFIHMSTDEVYGALGATGRFTLNSPHAPNSPYAASKAGAENLARAWHQTYELPVIITNCSNNYGPYQFPEKLIPNLLLKAIHGEIMPIYGTGDNVREWLYVTEMAEALGVVLARGKPGKKYHLGGSNEISNLALIHKLCEVLDAKEPDSQYCPHRNFIQFVADRPGHDFRYALDCSATFAELGWQPQIALQEGLERTAHWYLANPEWWKNARIAYSGIRLGLGQPVPQRRA